MLGSTIRTGLKLITKKINFIYCKLNDLWKLGACNTFQISPTD